MVIPFRFKPIQAKDKGYIMLNKKYIKKLNKNYNKDYNYDKPIGLLFNNTCYYWGKFYPGKAVGKYLAYQYSKKGVAYIPFSFINLGFINKNPKKIIKGIINNYTQKENYYAVVVFVSGSGTVYGVPLPIYIQSPAAGKSWRGAVK